MAERQITLAPILPRWLPRFRMALQTALRANFPFFLPKTQLKMCHVSSFTHMWYILSSVRLTCSYTQPPLPCLLPASPLALGPRDHSGSPVSPPDVLPSAWQGPVLASDRPMLTLVGPDCPMFFLSLKSRNRISAVPLDHFRRKKA